MAAAVFFAADVFLPHFSSPPETACDGALLAYQRRRPVLAEPCRVLQVGEHPEDVEGGVQDGGGDTGGPLAVPFDRGLNGKGVIYCRSLREASAINSYAGYCV